MSFQCSPGPLQGQRNRDSREPEAALAQAPRLCPLLPSRCQRVLSNPRVTGEGTAMKSNVLSRPAGLFVSAFLLSCFAILIRAERLDKFSNREDSPGARRAPLDDFATATEHWPSRIAAAWLDALKA